jgi:3-methyladenine DNA glycosylase AlkD
MGRAHGDLVVELQRRLETRTDPKTKAWWESYLKRTIPFRGVKMADIRAALHGWLSDEAIQTGLSREEQKSLAISLMRETYAEDKLAGILYLQEVLLPEGAVDCGEDLARFAALFQQGSIHDWNTCDWFCVKVLGPLAQREGEPCAQAISQWRTANNLWQRRASGVAFVNLAKKGDRNFAGFTDMLLETCAATVRHPERFAQTGTGWVLRELSLAEPERVTEFVEEYIHCFSREALRSAVAKLPGESQARLKQVHKERGESSRGETR